MQDDRSITFESWKLNDKERRLQFYNMLIEEQKSWIEKIQVFGFDIVCNKGRENVIAGTLTREYEDAPLAA